MARAVRASSVLRAVFAEHGLYVKAARETFAYRSGISFIILVIMTAESLPTIAAAVHVLIEERRQRPDGPLARGGGA